MKKPLFIICLALFGLSFTTLARPNQPEEKQLVSVRVTYQNWNEYRPWQKAKPSTRRFFGVVVPGNRILVFSKNLNDATLIQVEKFDRPPRVPARIIHQDHQIGIALITVDEPGFFDNLSPADLAQTTPAGGTDFHCVAWSQGQLLQASCRWSRVVVRTSSVPYFNYAGIYFITDLENGGLGEPVYSGDKLVALTKYKSGDRLTTVSAELIQAYLTAVDMPEYPGFAHLGIHWQYNRGKAQSAHFGLEGKPRGIRVRSCIPGGSADGVLQTDDILLELNGHPIDSQGDYLHPRYGRLDHALIVADGHYAGQTISARILRAGKELEVQIPLKNIPPSADLIPQDRYQEPPPYLIAGGFVFRELDEPYLRAWGKKWEDSIPVRLRIYLKMERATLDQPRKRLLILADVFPDEYNLGYHELAQQIVDKINGRTIASVADMEEAFKHPQNGFHLIEFMPSFGTQTVILDANEFDAATERIMQKYQIPTRLRLRATS